MEKVSRIEVTEGWEGGRSGELLFNGHRVSVGFDGKVPEVNSGDGGGARNIVSLLDATGLHP